MRKFQKAAVVVAMLGSVSFLGAGVGNAGDGGDKFKFDNKQNQSCGMNEGYEGLIGLDDLAVNLNLIAAYGDVDQSEKKSQSCGQTFNVGKHH
ncbi:hypothetical protein CLM62_03475 [Streptomyces sp. SA15]|uniref:hypothetical protein n=1 Tax=Streptomyces sp. SA15 TaxID=934019 RepID=UPI000BAEE403|nr:hypothetical protein [Streptomyces sp. SA15]PAZ17243.1 hypothetical protein CLM62_03475 [Streptomyces sp. SA15]